MEYYDPIDRTSKRYAALVTVVVMLGGSLLLGLIKIDVSRFDRLSPPLEIVFETEAATEEPPRVYSRVPRQISDVTVRQRMSRRLSVSIATRPRVRQRRLKR